VIINLIKTANGKFWPADEQAEEQSKKLKNGDVYKANITVDQNYELHKKIFGFFGFCCNYWYGDINASKDKLQLELTREELTIAAGYFEQKFYPDGKSFKVVAKSISYASMPDDEKQDFYKRITQSALDNIFNNGADDNTMNQLLSWF